MERINVDFSGLEGTNCYCSAESAAVIRQKIAGLPAAAFHCIGTGDYHYQTLFWLEKLQEPFCLVLFDNHPDDQDGAFGGELLSCGGWVAAARRLPCCRADVWIRSAADFPVLERLPQGSMSLEGLKGALRRVIASRRLLGVDLCGGNTVQTGASPEVLALNASTGEALYGIFREILI